jgi:hypothetical protein
MISAATSFRLRATSNMRARVEGITVKMRSVARALKKDRRYSSLDW